ncbi:MAG: IclR family transcriptional regulator [Acidobacteriia bacterium]|nr:IclR family transcriptional regulator [Terriglobia bacterium]
MRIARTTTGKYVVEAVAKALDILEAFNSAEGLTLNEISQQVGLNKSRTFRLLYTLAERGYVERSADGARYALGMKLFERASNVRRDLKDVAHEFMLELHHRFNETVNLGVLDNGQVLYLDILQNSRPFRMTATAGCRMPTYMTSMGKAILAYLPVEDPSSPAHAQIAHLSRMKLQVLRRDLELVRRRGYAMDNEENEPGVACIGAPVFDAKGLPVAAVSVSGPVHRILGKERNIAASVIEACSGVSKILGFQTVEGRSSRKAG